MRATNHSVTHFYQPTSNTCGYASLAMLLSYYTDNTIVEDVIKAVPQPTDENGKPTGSITSQLATWCQTEGYSVDFYSFDFLITDLAWQNITNEQLLENLKTVKNSRNVTAVGGKFWSQAYVQGYIDLLEAGGNLTIQSHITSDLLYGLLQNGPIFVNVCSPVIHSRGRQVFPESSSAKLLAVDDDINGTIGTHSIVVYGNDENGNFLVADPWDGREVVDSETLLCAVTAAIIECDSQCFQITKRG